MPTKSEQGQSRKPSLFEFFRGRGASTARKKGKSRAASETRGTRNGGRSGSTRSRRRRALSDDSGSSVRGTKSTKESIRVHLSRRPTGRTSEGSVEGKGKDRVDQVTRRAQDMYDRFRGTAHYRRSNVRFVRGSLIDRANANSLAIGEPGEGTRVRTWQSTDFGNIRDKVAATPGAELPPDETPKIIKSRDPAGDFRTLVNIVDGDGFREKLEEQASAYLDMHGCRDAFEQVFEVARYHRFNEETAFISRRTHEDLTSRLLVALNVFMNRGGPWRHQFDHGGWGLLLVWLKEAWDAHEIAVAEWRRRHPEWMPLRTGRKRSRERENRQSTRRGDRTSFDTKASPRTQETIRTLIRDISRQGKQTQTSLHRAVGYNVWKRFGENTAMTLKFLYDETERFHKYKPRGGTYTEFIRFGDSLAEFMDLALALERPSKNVSEIQLSEMYTELGRTISGTETAWKTYMSRTFVVGGWGED